MAQLFGMARLGRDAELRYTQDGTAVASLALAFDYGKKGQDGKRPTQWVEASIWRQRAESLAPYLLKGTRLSVVVDDIHVETFQKSDGTQGVKLVGVVSTIEFGSAPQAAGQTPQPTQQRQAAPQQTRQAPASLADMSDDVPF
ncbi:single-stranded DNA-binding protein [bacterium SGD-2]|nr:single-stranded DNA-binding protein [bacterium SGD-2]